MIGHDISSCKRLQQDANVICCGETKASTKVQQHYRPIVAGAHDATKGFFAQVVGLWSSLWWNLLWNLWWSL